MACLSLNMTLKIDLCGALYSKWYRYTIDMDINRYARRNTVHNKN